MTEYFPSEPTPEEPERAEASFTDQGELTPPNSETLPEVMERLAEWKRHANEPDVAVGEGVSWQPGPSVNAFWRDACRFITAIAAQEAHEHPDDQEVQDRYTFWLEQVQHWSEVTDEI